MIRLITSIVALLILLNATVYADRAVIEVAGDTKYKAVRLGTEIYNKANSNLSDLMLYDESDEVIPYFINSYEINQNASEQRYPIKLIDTFVKDDFYYHDFSLAQKYTHDVISTSVTVESSNDNFAKNIELYGGFDGVNWEFVSNDKLYSVQDSKKLYINFAKPVKYTHLRFKISDSAERVSFKGGEFVYNQKLTSLDHFIQSEEVDFSIEEVEKETILTISGFKNVRLREIELVTDSMFKRNVRLEGGTGKVLYNLKFNETAYADTVLNADGFKSDKDEIRVIVSNGDDKPIKVEKILAAYYTDEIVFEYKSGQKVFLSFGDAEKTAPPRYDIANYKDMVLSEKIDRLTVSFIESENVPVPDVPKDYTWIYNLVIILIAVVLGVIFLLKLHL